LIVVLDHSELYTLYQRLEIELLLEDQDSYQDLFENEQQNKLFTQINSQSTNVDVMLFFYMHV